MKAAGGSSLWDVGPDKVALVPSDLVDNKEGRAHPLAWVEYTEGPSLKSALTFCVRHTGVLFPEGGVKWVLCC